MDKEKMININAALLEEPIFSSFEKDTDTLLSTGIPNINESSIVECPPKMQGKELQHN